ncbi:spherulation-specific family 4 protein [Caminibacter pacificus]|uniref:Spherulation-specific family 4 protein n=1 Tax=Caminibacter pacificus TaxID=1424653 RepID=A0AAJ4UXY0_9BACT|nr:spherulation-specific family 4 protein [Caminibacter pacificus]QCI27696.1 hypothetical protein C6V80_01570 [Caminibacter pacificus]ROR40128.1 spherulation-specific family 4 protein [Caminibacter pacificus]
MRYFFILTAFLFLGCNLSVTTDNSKKIIVPQYFYDYNLWDEVAKADIKGYVIINPANGPGDNVDSAYVNDIDNLLYYGKTPIGYIYTKWGDRNLSDVEADVDKWLELYPKIKGFFVDEASNTIDRFSYYQELADYIKSKGDYKIVLNPGTSTNAVYFSIADTIVTYEGLAKDTPSDVCEEYSSQSAIIVYDANESVMRELVNRPCSYFYITDDNDSNPYDSLPSYFDEEIRLLK